MSPGATGTCHADSAAVSRLYSRVTWYAICESHRHCHLESVAAMPVLEFTKYLPAPLEQVFSFHADPYNLLKITPPAMKMVVTNPERVEMAEGVLIGYSLRVNGLPMRWSSRIDWYDPPRGFTDRQLSGPYRKWVHTHTFEAQGEGTLVHDHVDYELPLGALGAMVGGRLVSRQLAQIFAYREQQLESIFPASHPSDL